MRMLKNVAKIELYLQAHYERGHRDRGDESGPQGSLALAQLDNVAVLCRRLAVLCGEAYR